MNITNAFRGALRRLAEVRSLALDRNVKRRSQPLPSILQSYVTRHDVLPKPTPVNLRRFAETPVARKAINVVKDNIAGMRWRIQPKNGRSLDEIPDGPARIRTLTDNLDAPNYDDSFRSLSEQVLEDIIVGGFGAVEVQLSEDPERPLLLWPVDGASIAMRTNWDGRPDSPRYEQVTGKLGSKASVSLNDDELIYIRLNSRTHTPFGLGRLEVAFETINTFLGAHRYAGRLASNSVVQYALWLQSLTPSHHERLIRWWQDEIEGTGRVPILSVDTKPEVLRFGGGTDADLRIGWQEFLLRIIANAFDLPPFLLGLEHDVNRNTAGELGDQAFRSAIVPTARLLAEHITRGAIDKKLGWADLEFVFTDVDARNEMDEVQIQEILLRNGVLTIDEVRQARGLPPLSQP
jgi:HK97 family phage portal protein